MNEQSPTVLDRILELCDWGTSTSTSAAQVEEFASIGRRARGPLRLAILGGPRTGKTTLLNALVGERVTPTSAGQQVSIPIWCSYGLTYEIQARMLDGSSRALPFRRQDGLVELDVSALEVAQVKRLEIAWPSPQLRGLVLIDSNDSARLPSQVDGDQEDRSAFADPIADAVIYLTRRLDVTDAAILRQIVAHSRPNASPVNTILLLSCADEIGDSRRSAMQSAALIAGQYAADERIRALAIAVLPVAAMLAETGSSLREAETASLRELAMLDTKRLDRIQVSAEQFLETDVGKTSIAIRKALLARFGMFGIRFAITNLHDGHVRTAARLSRALVEVSGIGAVRIMINRHFMPRSEVLKARSCLEALRSLARSYAHEWREGSDLLLARIERIEMASQELAEMRLIHMMLTGMVEFAPEAIDEVRRLTNRGIPTERLGLENGASYEAVRDVAHRGVDDWRRRGANPLATPQLRDACEIIAHIYESLLAEIA